MRVLKRDVKKERKICHHHMMISDAEGLRAQAKSGPKNLGKGSGPHFRSPSFIPLANSMLGSGYLSVAKVLKTQM